MSYVISYLGLPFVPYNISGVYLLGPCHEQLGASAHECYRHVRTETASCLLVWNHGFQVLIEFLM